MLHIRCEWNGEPRKDGTYKGHTVGLYSRRHFGYGYYEARVRFTKHPGWWAAFWMHNEGRNNQLGGDSMDEMKARFAQLPSTIRLSSAAKTFWP